VIALRRILALLAVLATPASADTAADRFAPKRGFSTDIWEQWLSVDDMISTPGFLDTYPDYPRVLPAGTFEGLAAHGFDTVRIAADPAPLLALWGTDRAEGLLANLRQRVLEAQAAGLKVILDLHTYPHPGEAGDIDAILASPQQFDTYVDLVGAVAARIADLDPDRTALEVMNEPTNDCDPIYSGSGTMAWPAQLKRLHDAARANAAALPLVLSGACWGGADGLAVLDPAAVHDDNVIWSFHTYDPFSFSHQTADWTDSPLMFLSGLPYPPSRMTDAQAKLSVAEGLARAKVSTSPYAADATPQALAQIVADYRAEPRSDAIKPLDTAQSWADAHAIPHARLYLGEFGALWRPDSVHSRDPASHFRFLSDKRAAAEARGFGWSVWSFSGSMAITDPGYTLNPLTCHALGLAQCQ
jgi:hypothetical protein